MSIKRIGDLVEKKHIGIKWDSPRPCHHPEHNVPMHISLPNGRYEHTCPACGKVTQFAINNPVLM